MAQEGSPKALEVYESIKEADVWAALRREVRKADGDAVKFDPCHSAKTIPGDGKTHKD